MCSRERTLSWIRALSFSLLLAGCGGVSGHSGDSETHFLKRCDGSCSDGLTCVCGVCTKVCEESASCRQIADSARCVEPDRSACESAPALVCDVECIEARDCNTLGAEYRCDQGACRLGTPLAGEPQAGAGGADSGAATGGRSTSEGGTSAAVGGRSTSGGSPGTGGNGASPATTCYAAFAGSPVDIDAFDGSPYVPTFVSTADGFVGVAHGSDSLGYSIAEFAADGQIQGTLRTLWPDVRPMSDLHLAVSGDVLAVVDLSQDEDTSRQTCRLAMAQLGGAASIRPPTLYGDTPNTGSVLNEAQACGVAAVDDGFVVLWTAMTSDTTTEFTLFAQRFDRDGIEQGDRFTLASGDKRSGQFSAASAGKGVVVAAAGSQDAQLELSVIEGGDLSTTPLDTKVNGSSDVVTLAPARDGLLARAGDTLSVIDRDGSLLHGPVDVASGTRVAALDTGYVLVSSEEYLVARTLNAELGALSEPTAISDDRDASADQLLYAPDGSRVGLFYYEAGRRLFVGLQCSDTPPGSPGPSACPVQSEISPLDHGCTDPVCHVMVRLDYLTLGLRGWAAIGGDASPVDSEAARVAARVVFDENSEYLSEETVSGPEAGLFTVLVSPSDFGAFALVGEESGVVVAAGGVVWSGTGQYWVPTEWNDPADLACANDAVEPAQTYLDSSECSSEDATPATASQALDVVLRSNLAAHVAEQGPFSAFTYLYTPSVGACSPENAEYLVVLTQGE